MKLRHTVSLALLLALCGCTAGADLDSMLRDFDNYDQNLKAVATDDQTLQTLDQGRQKRDEAGTLVEQGKKTAALPMVEEALADARLALEMDRMNAAERRAEKCRLEVEQARTSWREAMYVLEQTEDFVGAKASISRTGPEAPAESPALPATTLEPDSFPPATVGDVSTWWDAWRSAANDRKVAVADLESAYRQAYDATQLPNVKPEAEAYNRYVAARMAQALECRVLAADNERVCMESTRMTAGFGDARADALSATLDLERGLQANLRDQLDHLRAEAKSRQDELYKALSQMEGKFASIRRDARGTIVSLADILFDFDKATLRRDVEFNLVKIATILNQFPEMKILIEGHTDSIGTEEYNLGLSQRRAKAVYEFLVSQDVVADRMSWAGYGESRPVADNDTDEGRQRNRRVDLVIQDAVEQNNSGN